MGIFRNAPPQLLNGVNPILGRITFKLRDDLVAKLLQSSATSPQQKTDYAASLGSMV